MEILSMTFSDFVVGTGLLLEPLRLMLLIIVCCCSLTTAAAAAMSDREGSPWRAICCSRS